MTNQTHGAPASGPAATDSQETPKSVAQAVTPTPATAGALLSEGPLQVIGSRYLRGENWETGRAAFDQAFVDAHHLLAHIDAQAAQIERYRNMVVALEQELAEIHAQPMRFATGVDWPEYVTEPRTRTPAADRTLDALLGFEVQA